MKVIIDRFEGKYVVCQTEGFSMINIERKKIPKQAKEGDTLNIEDDCITIDILSTKKNKNIIETLIKDLWE